MPLDYTDGRESDGSHELDLLLNKDQPVPAAAITLDTPVDSYGERYRDIVEFDLSSPTAYASIVTRFPNAWDSYYGPEIPSIVTPAYSDENAVLLREAVKFYLYINEGETINVDLYAPGGLISDGEAIRSDSPRISPYTAEGGGAYENPNAFYDQAVYNSVTSNGTQPIPLLPTDGSRDMADRAVAKPYLSDLYSSAQLLMKEYEVTKASPKTEYDWGGSYSSGRNTY
jgi:hypothetical protein